MTVVIMVSARIKPGTQSRFEQAYREVSEWVNGTEGHLGDRLLRSRDDDHVYVLLGFWRSAAEFQAWEDAPLHREATTPLRPFWDGPVTRVIYDSVSSAPDPPPAPGPPGSVDTNLGLSR